jgi:hypothetical protein
MAAALEGGEWSAARPGRFTPGKDPVPIVQEAGWAPGPIWTGGQSRPVGVLSPDRPARSQSLYRLRYPAHIQCRPVNIFQDHTLNSSVSKNSHARIWCDRYDGIMNCMEL